MYTYMNTRYQQNKVSTERSPVKSGSFNSFVCSVCVFSYLSAALWLLLLFSSTCARFSLATQAWTFQDAAYSAQRLCLIYLKIKVREGERERTHTRTDRNASYISKKKKQQRCSVMKKQIACIHTNRYILVLFLCVCN